MLEAIVPQGCDAGKVIGPILTFRPRPVVLRTTRKNVRRMRAPDWYPFMQVSGNFRKTYRQVAALLRYRSDLIRGYLQGLKVRCSTVELEGR